jgi:hypothetical protein
MIQGTAVLSGNGAGNLAYEFWIGDLGYRKFNTPTHLQGHDRTTLYGVDFFPDRSAHHTVKLWATILIPGASRHPGNTDARHNRYHRRSSDPFENNQPCLPIVVNFESGPQYLNSFSGQPFLGGG